MTWLLVAGAFSLGAVVGFLISRQLHEREMLELVTRGIIERQKHREDTNKWRH